MYPSSTSSLKLLLLLLLLNISCLHGNHTTVIAGDHSLHCVNDYLFTINCTMSFAPSESSSDSSSSYWLIFTETYEKKTFGCLLTNKDGNYFCSVDTSRFISDVDADDGDHYSEIFSDIDSYEISLCHNRTDADEICEVLDGKYTPLTHIKPNAPCCLTVSQNTSQHHFTWKSTYEEYAPDTKLLNNFEYELHFFKKGDRNHSNNRMISHSIRTDRTNYSVDDEMFAPDTEYTARVRSAPNMAFYKGNWSDWSCEVHWKMESTITDLSSNMFVPELKVFIPLCVFAILILLLCYVPVKQWKQSAFIPTPAPYFHTLYSDCQGDFKRWVITHENTADTLKAEISLQIDTLTKCSDSPEEERLPHFHHELAKGSGYKNIRDPDSDKSPLGIPYAVSTMNPPPAPEGLTLSSDPGHSAEGDSGCFLCSDVSLENSFPWHFNDYCNPSALKKLDAFAAEHQRALPTGNY